MAARVLFTTGFSRRYTGGVREFTVEAKNLRGVIREILPNVMLDVAMKPPG